MARGEGWHRILFILIVALLVLPPRALAEAPPIDAFARLPAFRLPELSPDGTRYAALEPVDGRTALMLYALDGGERRVLAQSARARIGWFAWVGNDRLIYAESFPGRRRSVDTTETRLYAVAAAGGSPVPLPDDGRATQVGNDVIALNAGDPNHILVNLNRDTNGRFSAFRIDVRDGTLERLERGTRNTVTWLADSAGQLRIRVDIDGTSKAIYGRAHAGDEFRLLMRYEIGRDPSAFPLALDPADPNGLYLASDRGEAGRQAIYRYDMARGEFGPPLFSHPALDVEEVVVGRDGRILGYSYRDDLPRTVYVDQEAAARQAKIDRALPDTANPIVSESADGRRALVIANGPRDPGTLYLIDDDEAALRLLGRSYADLDREDLAMVAPFDYTARDGLTIPAYLTRPSAGADERPPLVLLVHGGPTARDDMSFDMLGQFLASRGYAVLQVNFRGSSGYGRDFLDRGVGSWGRAMIDDLADGARAVVAKGLADGARTCVVGASYGGYAALMSVLRDPGLYRCAASIAGLTDLTRFLYEMNYFRFAAIRSRALRASAPDGDFGAISPVAQAARIGVPVLLVHGADDRIVSVQHTELMARALRRAGKPHERVIIEDGDHSFGDERQRRVLLKSLESFLERSLYGGS